MPYLAAIFALKFSYQSLHQIFDGYVEDIKSNQNLELLGTELHALTSAAKSVSGWLMRDATQSCREACGGHGYLQGNILTILKESFLTKFW